jgi:D-sedoheptulose 7-phosphate isomerase
MNWNKIAEDYLSVADEIFGSLQAGIESVAKELAARLRAGNKIMVCGNGGSAADAQHFAAELVNRFLKERRPYAGLALSTDTSVITSIGNDYGYGMTFEKQVKALGKKGDVLVAISTSGKAENVCRAVQAAKELGIMTVALTGGKGGKLAGMTDRSLVVGSTACTPRIQEGHQLIIHSLCERIEEELE